MAVEPSLLRVDYSRDDDLNDFTLQTLRERYMLPGETSPQDAFARACAAFADDVEHGQRLYEYVSKQWFMFATPLLSNGGSDRGLPISCFLTSIEDSRESISDHYDEVIWLSSMGGGIGSYWGGLRSDGEKTSRGSQSNGVIPFICVDDKLILAVSQGGTRRGSEAVYMDMSHPEIREFIVMRKTGGDANRKALNLHNAVMIPDAFMEAVRDDLPWNLTSPKDGSIRSTESARELWDLLLETRMQTGEPYMVFTDTINRAMPKAQRDLGLKVQQSNLCVSGDTQILTRYGYAAIGALFQTGIGEIDVWNGMQWTPVEVMKTAERADLIRVWFEDGDYIDCTPEHQFYLPGDVKVRAIDLNSGDRLQQDHVTHPQVLGGAAIDTDLAYTAGWATMGGFEDHTRMAISTTVVDEPGTHDPQMHDSLRALSKHSIDSALDEDGVWVIRYEPHLVPSGRAPFDWDYRSRRAWVAGALDAAGQWLDIDGEWWLTLGSTDSDMIREMRLIALQSGLVPRIRIDDGMCIFSIDAASAASLTSGNLLRRQGAKPFPEIARPQCVVAEVRPLPWTADTYCATEPVSGRLTLNGYVTGNCTEITLVTGIDHLGKKRTAVCCLSSVNAETYDEWADHPTFIEDLMRMLDNTLQVFIDNAPVPQMEAAVYSATQERAVGLGLLGFQSYLQKHRVSMESQAARVINRAIFRDIRRGADAASLKLGAERGEAPDMAGTGERFSHKMAVAPNASSSILCRGTSPSTEPHRANAYLHKTLSGSFPVKNRFLEEVLEELGINTDETWKSIIGAEGSCQHIEAIPAELRAVFKTATEIDQRAIVVLAADRQPSICQAQSMNLFFPQDADADYIYETHFMMWELGCKSAYYYRSTTPLRAENTNTRIDRTATVSHEDAPVVPIADEECFACQG